jgi:hypothetical protein
VFDKKEVIAQDTPKIETILQAETKSIVGLSPSSAWFFTAPSSYASSAYVPTRAPHDQTQFIQPGGLAMPMWRKDSNSSQGDETGGLNSRKREFQKRLAAATALAQNELKGKENSSLLVSSTSNDSSEMLTTALLESAHEAILKKNAQLEKALKLQSAALKRHQNLFLDLSIKQNNTSPVKEQLSSISPVNAGAESVDHSTNTMQLKQAAKHATRATAKSRFSQAKRALEHDTIGTIISMQSREIESRDKKINVSKSKTPKETIGGNSSLSTATSSSVVQAPQLLNY